MSLGRSKFADSYETRLVRMHQITDSACLALYVQESVLDSAMMTRIGWRPLTADSTAKEGTMKTLVTAPFHVIYGSLYCKDSITKSLSYAASVQGRLVERISHVDIKLSINPH